MPTDSVEAARAWRAKNDKRGTTRRASPKVSLASASSHLEKHKPIDPGEQPAEQDPTAAIWRAREAERIAYDQYATAVITARASAAEAAKDHATSELRAEAQARADADLAPLQSLLRAHGLALNNRLMAERSFEKHLRGSGQVAPVEHFLNILTSRLEPLASQLDNFAATVAPIANPAAPTVAEQAIAAALVAIRRQIAAACEPIPAAPASP